MRRTTRCGGFFVTTTPRCRSAINLFQHRHWHRRVTGVWYSFGVPIGNFLDTQRYLVSQKWALVIPPHARSSRRRMKGSSTDSPFFGCTFAAEISNKPTLRLRHLRRNRRGLLHKRRANHCLKVNRKRPRLQCTGLRQPIITWKIVSNGRFVRTYPCAWKSGNSCLSRLGTDK